ncbi:hypothetical protein IW136_006037 [Coemansia sp. RSA 678]|nr:hypothetical protein IW136_006037 [Coemansia sp. RSA 678]
MFRLAVARANAMKGVAQMQRRGLACTTLYVKGLSLNTTEDKLREMGEAYGPVYSTNILKATPADRFAVGFIKYYAGELPASVQELSQLPFPPQDEIDAVFEHGQNAIRELTGVEQDGWRLELQVSHKDKPDNIQFQARNQLRRERDPEFASGVRNAANRPEQSTGTYAQGYRDGFRDGSLKTNA